ncbi:MAG: hypothetical protein WCD11_25185 [Solirubrobacteraceae bacterium]
MTHGSARNLAGQHRRDEVREQVAVELGSELPADLEILGQLIFQDGHAAPPSGQGSASVRSASWSTLA